MVFDTRTHPDGGEGGALARGLQAKILRGETSWGVSHTRVKDILLITRPA